jgi:hypothetical protein
MGNPNKSFHNWALQRTLQEKIHAMMCTHDTHRSRLGAGKGTWRNSEICSVIGCSPSGANRALRKLSYALDVKPHYFRTEGGVVLEYIYSLK